ncbi:MAG: beta-lactamase family protein [Planctomycetes bacterium]|nr:beta-lactamase family protein [Planctomycetota bacterium]
MLDSVLLRRQLVWLGGIAILCGPAAGADAQQTLGDYTDVRELPTGYVGERITELLDAVNSNDAEKVKSFVGKRFGPEFLNFAPMEEHVEVFGQVYRESRGLEFYSIRKYKQEMPKGEVVVILRNKLTGGWQAFVLNIESAPPHRIMSLQFAPARPPSDLAPAKPITESEMGDALKAFVERLARADAFSGTVLLAKDGKVLFKGAYGLASKRFNVPNKIDTKFNLGSMNKMFTGTAVARLIQQGKLSLDDPLSKFLSTDWMSHDITDKIKIKHLLTHTSGLGSYFNETYMNSAKALFRELDDYKPLISDSTLAFEPGTQWQYSNTGMFLLGVVIEKVTGENYFEHIRENIYKPAGMINSDCYDMDRPVPNLAIGYSPESGDGYNAWSNNLYKHVIRGGPAGGGFSTVEDLHRFATALRQHKLLNEKYTQMLWSPKPEFNSPNYGFGFATHKSKSGERMVGHRGGFAGISANLDIFLDSGYTAAVMSNYGGAASLVADKIRELITATRE